MHQVTSSSIVIRFLYMEPLCIRVSIVSYISLDCSYMAPYILWIIDKVTDIHVHIGTCTSHTSCRSKLRSQLLIRVRKLFNIHIAIQCIILSNQLYSYLFKGVYKYDYDDYIKVGVMCVCVHVSRHLKEELAWAIQINDFRFVYVLLYVPQ